MRKQGLVYGLVVLFQTLTLTGIGLAMFYLAMAAPEASPPGGPSRGRWDRGWLEAPGLATPEPEGAAGLLAVDPVEHPVPRTPGGPETSSTSDERASPGGHLRQTASQVDDSRFEVCGSGAS